MTGVRGGKRLEQIPDISADAEVANAAGVDRDFHRIRFSGGRRPAFSRHKAGTASSDASTRLRTAPITDSELTSFRTSAIRAATSRISVSPKPRVVAAGLPSRMPLGIQRRIDVERNRVLVHRDAGAVERLAPLPCPARLSRKHRPASGAYRCRRKRCGSPLPASPWPAPGRWRAPASNRRQIPAAWLRGSIRPWPRSRA